MDVDVITIATFRLGSARSLQSLIQISSGVTLSIASGRTSILKLSLHSATWLQLLISSANSWPAPKEPCQGIDNDDKANSTGDLEGWRAQGTVYWSRTSCCSCWSLCRNCDFILRSCQIYVTPPICFFIKSLVRLIRFLLTDAFGSSNGHRFSLVVP